MGFLDKISGGILVGLFVFVFLMFGYSSQIDNNVNDTILDDEHFKGINDTFFGNLSSIQGDAKEQRSNFEGQTPLLGSDSGFGLLTVPRNIAKFTSMMFSSIGLVTQLLEDVIGVPAIVFNILSGLLVIIILVLGWKVIKGGGT